MCEPAGVAGGGPRLRDSMEELSPSQLAVKQLKMKFVEALRANDAREVLRILHTGKLDIDTVLEVEDPSNVLASYKQGKEEVEGSRRRWLAPSSVTVVTSLCACHSV